MWNERIKPDRSMIGKTVLLGRFTLHNYNGSLTLSSKTRSSIQAVNNHPYQQYEEQTMNNWKNYQLLSERKMKEEDPNSTPACRNFQELTKAISQMGMGETIKTDVNVWVNRIMTKKWFYEGCPACNKAA